MFIAVSNAHGWYKADTEKAALDGALDNSVYRGPDLRIKVWDCLSEAYCDDHGTPVGVLSDPVGREFKRQGKGWTPV